MNLRKVIPFVLVFFFLFVAVVFSQSVFKNFITAKDAKLMDGKHEFTFLSFNIPNLLLIEDNLPFECKNPWRLPNAYEIRDALLSIKQMGGKVARTYVIPVKRSDDLPNTPKYVLGPNKFNEHAFRSLDTTLAVANELGIRLVIPLMDNWRWMGGKGQYAQFRNKSEDEFWDDEQLKTDYKKMLDYIVNRKNTVTGVAYKDDKAIMIWELGNELKKCPVDWVNEMAAYLKSIDSHHLVNDGIQVRTIQKAIIRSPYVDVLSTHHYEGDPQKMLAHIKENLKQIAGKKPYYLGEFGFVSTQALKAVAQTALQEWGISGGLIWSLRFHNKDGGFYWHSEPFGKSYKAFHWPGFNSGMAYDEINVMDWVAHYNHQEKTYKISSPELLPIKDIGHIWWRGVTGVPLYMVQRSENPKGPWTNASDYLTDANVAYASLFNDQCVEQGKQYYYRIEAIAFTGAKTFSNIQGPVFVSSKYMIDDARNLAKTFQTKGKWNENKEWCRPFKEDLDRLEGDAGSEMVYRISGKIKKVIIKIFSENSNPAIRFFASENGRNYKALHLKKTDYWVNQKDYNYRHPIEFVLEKNSTNFQYFKIHCDEKLQIGRVEIEYVE